MAQAAGAAAIADDNHVRQARAHNTRWLAWLTKRLREAKIEVIPSVCNFVVVRFADAGACQAALEALANRSVLAMPLNGYGLPEALRISIGSEPANRAVVEALTGSGS